MATERFVPATPASEETPGLRPAAGDAGEGEPSERRDAGHAGHGHHGHGEEVELRPGWSRAKPEHIPQPTYWPAVLALGVTFAVWGLITTYVISAIGLALFALALGGWIWEMLHER